MARQQLSRGNYLTVGLVFLGGLCLPLVALEVGLRIFAPQHLKISVPAILDSELIYRLPAHAKGTDVKEEFSVRIETNSLGLRDREYSAVRSGRVVKRILTLGDSMTFAEGVETEDTYPKLLEQDLAKQNGTGSYEVINAAIRGYGTDQEYLLFEKLIPILKPDVALLGVYVGNDFEDNLYGHLFEVRGDELVGVPISEETSPKYRYYKHQSFIQTFPGYRILIEHSHLMNLIRSWWARIQLHRIFPDNGRDDQTREEYAWRLMKQLLITWKERARQQGIQPVLLMIPTWDQVYQEKDAINDARTERVTTLAHKIGVPVIDPRPALRRAAQESAPLYYPKDRHLTARGHRVVAVHLRERLATLGVVPYARAARSTEMGHQTTPEEGS